MILGRGADPSDSKTVYGRVYLCSSHVMEGTRPWVPMLLHTQTAKAGYKGISETEPTAIPTADHCFSFALSIWSPAQLAAQLAGIVGSVSDPSGASINGATVRATNIGTNLEWQTKTGPQGDYSVGQIGRASW